MALPGCCSRRACRRLTTARGLLRHPSGGGWLRSESVAGLRRNQWLEWIGITGCFAPESAIQRELDRRLAAAWTSDPTRQREKVLQRELTRTRKAIDRLLIAYQEELLSLDELRRRMPELRQREHALRTELNSILDQISDRAIYLQLAETLSDFLSRLRTSADTLDVQERQRIVASSSGTSWSATRRSSSNTPFPYPP